MIKIAGNKIEILAIFSASVRPKMNKKGQLSVGALKYFVKIRDIL